MLNYLLVFFLAFVLSLVLTPIAKWLSYRFNILDQPGQRKIHHRPIPLMGGVVIFLAWSLAILIFGYPLKSIVLVGFLLVIFGFVDDAGLKVKARYKIFFHSIFAFILVYLTGLRLNFFDLSMINWLLAAGFVGFLPNSMNMLDGMDGLVAGISCLAAVFLFYIGLDSGQTLPAVMAIALAGASLGFLRYNFNPATIFLGETGSTFLGFILAVISLKLIIPKMSDIAMFLNLPRLHLISFLVPLIILGIPIFDTLFVFINRFLHKISLSTPGKDHSHHRINLLGLSRKFTVMLLYGVQILLGAVAMVMINSNVTQFLALLLILGVFIVFAVVFLLKIEVYSSKNSS